MPEAECRKRLFELYGRGLQIPTEERDRFVARTEGASGAFVGEFLRKAALLAAETSAMEELSVGERELELALSELVLGGGQLTQTLLGADIRGVSQSE